MADTELDFLKFCKYCSQCNTRLGTNIAHYRVIRKGTWKHVIRLCNNCKNGDNDILGYESTKTIDLRTLIKK